MTTKNVDQIDVEEFLAHFGVKGMRWGVVDKTETSSGESGKAKLDKRDTKAQKYVDKANSYQKQIDTLNKNPGKTPQDKAFVNFQKQQLQNNKTLALKDAQAKRDGKMTDSQKTVAKGAAIAGGILLAYGAYNALESGKAHSVVMRGKSLITGQGVKTWKQNSALSTKDLTPDAIMASVVRPINPDYGGIGTKMNCRRATFAYEMRRRGYDVAATKTTNAKGQDITGMFNALNPNVGKDVVGPGRLGMLARVTKEGIRSKGQVNDATPFLKKYKAAAEDGTTTLGERLFAGSDGIFHGLAKNPDGARGELTMAWSGGGGHSMSWEKIKGQVHIFDNQNAKRYSSVEDFDDIAKNIASSGFTRLDNVPLNDAFLMRWLKDAA